MTVTRRFDITCGALLDVGRPDLAATLRESRAGDPSCLGGIWRHDRPHGDSVLIVRAMRLGHMSDPDGPPIACGTIGSFPACDDPRWCDVCLAPEVW